jgi:Zn-dependent protease with chaperone function
MRSLRAVLAVSLLAGFYVLAAALVVGLCWLDVYISRDHLSIGTVFLLALAGAVVLAVVRSFRLPRDPAGPVADELAEDAFPALWVEIRAAAAAAGTRPPDRVIVDLRPNAAVSEQARALGLLSGPRTLYVGLPLLAGLTVAQLRALLGHEFGHYASGDTRLGAVVYRGREQLARTIAGLGKHRVLRRFFLEYRSVYLMVSQAVARRQERTADLIAAGLTSPGTVVAMLRKIRALAAAWSAYLPMIKVAQFAGIRPLDLAGGFRRFVDDPVRAAEMRAIEQADPDDEPPAARRTIREQAADLAKVLYASHPTLRQRAAVLDALPDNDIVTDDRPALVLLDGKQLDSRVRGLLGAPLRDAPALEWDAIASAMQERMMKPVADRVAATAETILGRPTAVADVLDLVDSGRAAEVGDQDDQDSIPDNLYAYLGEAGRAAGLLQARIGWHGPFVRWVDASGEPAALTLDLVMDALAGPDTGKLRAAVRPWLSRGRADPQISPVK